MRDEIDWTLATYEGCRLRQHAEFRALPFAEKLARIEQMGEIVEFFASRRAMREGSSGSSAAPEESDRSAHERRGTPPPGSPHAP